MFGTKNGKGKEYSNGKLIFEGKYLNGEKWNGKGYNNKQVKYELKEGKGYIKEYYSWNEQLEFEGEYLNGKRNGKGKEYDYNSKLKFEGEYLYDEKRKGKLYINNKLEYDGEYLYKKKWNGKGYDENLNIIYELINGNGQGKEYDCNGKLKFEGECLNGKRNGIGKEYDDNVGETEYKNGEICRQDMVGSIW